MIFNHSSNPGDIALFYFPDDGTGLTAAQVYNFGGGNGGATQIGSDISPATNAASTTISISLPQNTTGSNVSYLIYGILANGNGNYSSGVCEPVALTSVLVKPETETATLTTTATICEANFGNSENVIDLNTLITAGNTSGTWEDTDGTGSLVSSFFTAEASDANNTYTFTYVVTGVDGSGVGSCHNNEYTIMITVDECTVPCPDITSLTAPLEVCSDENFDLTINFESGVGNLAIHYGEDISLTPEQYYTDNSALTAINANFATSGTSHMTTISFSPNTDTTNKKIYLYVALASGNSNFNDPFCRPLRTYIINQNSAVTISAAGTDPTTCSGTDGSIVLQTVAADSTYQINYLDDGSPVGPVNLTANSTGQITIFRLKRRQLYQYYCL